MGSSLAFGVEFCTQIPGNPSDLGDTLLLPCFLPQTAEAPGTWAEVRAPFPLQGHPAHRPTEHCQAGWALCSYCLQQAPPLYKVALPALGPCTYLQDPPRGRQGHPVLPPAEARGRHPSACTSEGQRLQESGCNVLTPDDDHRWELWVGERQGRLTQGQEGYGGHLAAPSVPEEQGTALQGCPLAPSRHLA